MSKEENCEDKRHSTKENIKEDQTVIQSSEECIKNNIESSSRDSDRQVTINEDVITSLEETSFMDKAEDPEPNNDKNKTFINNTHSESTDDIISIQDITEDENIENQNLSKPKCFKCMSEIFECTIWFFRSMASSIRSSLQNCCCCNKETVDIQNRKFDDDGEYWNGNVTNNDGEIVLCFKSDRREDGNKTKETFEQTDLAEVRNHSKDNEGFVDIGINADHTASEHKRFSNGNETEQRNSTISAVCHVNHHHESRENKDVTNIANGGVPSSGSKVCHDSDRGGHGGGRDSVHSRVHNVGHENGHTGGLDGGHTGGHDGGSDD